jgi:hypothetical protein
MMVLAQSSNTSVHLEWSPPEDDGGCPLSGYALYRSDPDASTETWVEANAINDANIRNKPYLTSAAVTNFASGAQGKSI